ncbi:uncharacterized protein LOC134656557 [Cydia amplana]|uniref:uncharacterized protein LOC134656557 n=1 Tax=Cydia amplana TaxID=1869771 RepID=UPI002FE6400D
MVKTRGALEREKLKHTTDAQSEVPCPKNSKEEEFMDRASQFNAKALSLQIQPSAKEGSIKTETEHGYHRSNTSNKTSMSSLQAKKKQLELDAAEAKARIEKELIDKKLDAELAKLDEEYSQKSRCSGEQRSILSETSQKVEQWLEKSRQDDQDERVLATPWQEPNPGPSSLQTLAQAMEKLATTTQSANTRLLSRLATSKDLPLFSGESLEWIQFKKSYEQSTMLCNYSDTENIARLEKCLRGEAKETVSSLFTTDTSPRAILDALELRFGRPDLIINKILTQFKKLQPLPQAYHIELVNFAVRVKNYVAAAESIKQTDHLRSPELLSIVISKCPSALINKWADYIYEHSDTNKAKLQLFSEFLHKEATKIAAAGVTHIHSQNEHKFPKKMEDRKLQVHPILNNDNDTNTKCKFCKVSYHPLTNCIKFKRALRKDKWRFVKINRICHKCLLLGHGKETCPAASCDVDGCGLPHHRLLHWPNKPNAASAAPRNNSTNEDPNNTPTLSATDESANNNPTTAIVTNTVVEPSDSDSVYLKSVRVNLHGPGGTIATYALLDDGAAVSLISADLANCVNLQAVLGRPLTAEHALTTVLYERAKPAAEICNACTPPSTATPADILAARRETHTCTNADTHSSPQSSSDALSDSTDKQLHELVRRSFALESIGVNSKPRVNKDDIRAVNIIDNSAKLINGSYEISLPWKNDAKLPDSYPNAYKRFLAVERRMLSDEGYASRYTERINHLLENNYARLLSDDELLAPHKRIFYLAHFGVDNKNKKKLRLVHDASAATAGRSLNDYLLQGPDLLQSLLGIMLRFREKPVAIMGDIKEFFHRIKITKEDQHALRFLWRENANSELKTYVMTSLLFGTNCSPFIAQHIKNKNAMRFQNEMPEAVKAILKSHYMDDYIESVDNEQLAIKMITEVSEIHKQGGFEIRNWISNKPEVLECTPKETLSDKAIRFKTGCDDVPERTLGLLWYPASDTFGFDLSLKRIPTEIINLQRKPTKRELLRIYMSIFDIFGFLAPFTVKAKIMLRNIWRTDTKWDDEIPTNEYTVFRNWITELQTLKDLRIPRFYFHDERVMSERDNTDNARCHTLRQNETTIELELHIFCDAAPTAYAAVAYWRKVHNINEVQVSFIASKCRSSPVKKYITIPKLEMESAVIACRLADTIAREHRLTACTRYFWTDSLIVLHQIKNDTRNYKVFIANRLGEIDELSQSCEWNYIPTDLNIADKATKLNTYELNNDCDWLRGPEFLYSPRDTWPKYDAAKQNINKDQLLQVNTLYEIKVEDLPVVPDLNKFSSWTRLWRCMANVLLFITRCRRPGNAQIDADTMQRAETELLRYSQMKSFPEEIYALKNNKAIEPNSRLRKLTPILDDHGLLRVGGRIDAASYVDFDLKRPVILDGHDYITRLIIKRYHEMAAHGNNETVVNDIRQKYWIVNLRPTVRTVATRCLYCRIKKARPSNPRMGDLPAARLAHHQRPFTHCGVDLFGHMEVTVGRRHEKRYGVLFTCMTVRAIHIELVPSLSADSFIMALRRMASRRGWPYRMYSDHGTNFRGADAELRRSFKEINDQASVRDLLTTHELEWRFISPASPHMGGSWERLIRSVKTSLKVILKERAPREEVLITLLAEVENIVNSRPLSYVSTDHGDPESLTPNHFLIGSSSNLPVPGVFDDTDLFRKKMWRIAQRLTDAFWRRWMREVLPNLLPRQKWCQEGKQLKKGDVVVIVDPAMPRNVWPKGRVHEVHAGADGRIRIVDVKTQSGMLTRPVARLALLPTADDDCP